jgi:hypothetical protein
MFKRIKNLLDISRYSVEEVVNSVHRQPSETQEQHLRRTWGYDEPKRIKLEVTSSQPMAKIVDITSTHPFDEFQHETTK